MEPSGPVLGLEAPPPDAGPTGLPRIRGADGDTRPRQNAFSARYRARWRRGGGAGIPGHDGHRAQTTQPPQHGHEKQNQCLETRKDVCATLGLQRLPEQDNQRCSEGKHSSAGFVTRLHLCEAQVQRRQGDRGGRRRRRTRDQEDAQRSVGRRAPPRSDRRTSQTGGGSGKETHVTSERSRASLVTGKTPPDIQHLGPTRQRTERLQ